MKRIFVILTTFTFIHSITNGQINYRTFSFYYSFKRLDSVALIQPTIRVSGTKLIYTYEKNNCCVEKVHIFDTLSVATLRQSSIDSIYKTLKELKDTQDYKPIPCILRLGIDSMVVVFDQDTTKFIQNNTFHRAALKIGEIINQYLQKDKLIMLTEQLLIDCENWQKEMRKWE